MRCEMESRVEQSLDAGAPLHIVEAMLDEMCLPSDEAEALKLYAWAWHETRPKRNRLHLLAVLRS